MNRKGLILKVELIVYPVNDIPQFTRLLSKISIKRHWIIPFFAWHIGSF